MDLPEAILAPIPTPAPVPPSSQAPHVILPPMHSGRVRRAPRAFQDYVPNVRANDTLHESFPGSCLDHKVCAHDTRLWWRPRVGSADAMVSHAFRTR